MPYPDNNMRKARCKAGKSWSGGVDFFLGRATVYADIFRHSRAIANGYAYAESNLVFLEHNHPAGLTIFRCAALKLANDDHRQRKLGQLPTFDAKRFPKLKSQLEPGVWDKG